MIKDLELKRQLFHAALGIVLSIAIYNYVLTWQYLLGFVIFGFILSIICKTKRVPIISSFLNTFERKEELKSFPGKGALFYFMGAFIVTFLFNNSIAAASVIILALGDSICVIFKRYSKIKHPLSNKKHLEGMVAGIIAATIGASFFVPVWHALIASTIAMIVEGIEIELHLERIDDNITIPPVAALTLYFSAKVI